MAWFIIFVSSIFEATWAVALGKIDNWKKPREHSRAIIAFVIGSLLSLLGLGIAMQDIPTGTAYAVWTATGAALTVSYGILRGEERLTWQRALLLLGLIACVTGLRVVS